MTKYKNDSNEVAEVSNGVYRIGTIRMDKGRPRMFYKYHNVDARFERTYTEITQEEYDLLLYGDYKKQEVLHP